MDISDVMEKTTVTKFRQTCNKKKRKNEEENENENGQEQEQEQEHVKRREKSIVERRG